MASCDLSKICNLGHRHRLELKLNPVERLLEHAAPPKPVRWLFC